MTGSIQTVTGSITPEKLGRTLMHEHVLVGYAGWDADWIRPGLSRQEMRARASDKLEEMKAEGITSMIDPCPAESMGKVSVTRTWRGVKIRVSFDARDLATACKAGGVGEVHPVVEVNGRPVEGNVITPVMLAGAVASGGVPGGNGQSASESGKALDVTVRWEPVAYREPKMTAVGASVPAAESRRS